MPATLIASSTWNSGQKEHEHHIPIPAGNVFDRICVAVSLFLNSPPPTPTGWNVLFTLQGSTICLAEYWKESDGTETELVLETYPGNPKDVSASATVKRWAGIDNSYPPEKYVGPGGRQGTIGQSATPNPVIFTPSFGAVGVLYETHLAWRPSTTGLVSGPAGYSNLLSDSYAPANPLEGVGIASADIVNSDGYADPGVFTLAQVAAYAVETVAHKVA